MWNRDVFRVLLLALVVLALAVGPVAAQPDHPRRLENDDNADAELDCFECSRGELLTFDLRTGQLIRRTSPEAVPNALRLLSEGGQGALVPPAAPDRPKDFGILWQVPNTLVGDYPKHVKIRSYYFDEHGDPVSSGCSGTMIDPFHVLTAGHCVYKWEDGEGDVVEDWAHTVEVFPALAGDTAPFGVANSVQLHSYSGWINNEDYDWDLAVIDLDWPIGALTGWRPYGSDPGCGWFTSGLWEHFGYPGEGGYPGNVMYTQSGQFDGCESSGNEVWFDRDMYGGQSGGGCVREGAVYTIRSNSTLVGVDDWDTYDVAITNTMFNDITTWINQDTPGIFDLIPLELLITEDLVKGEFFSFDFLLHNYASITADGTWPVNIYLSLDDIIDQNDFLLHSVVIGGPIGPKETVQKHVGFPVTCYSNAGTYYFGIQINYWDADFTNNWTMPQHAVQVQLQGQPAPDVPVLSSPPDWSQCRQRDGLVLMWSDTAPLGKYVYQLGTSPGYGPVDTTTSSSVTVSDLAAGTWYYWRVRAKDDCSDWSAWTDEHRFRTEPDPNTPATVVDPPDSSHCTSTSPTLQWTSLDGAESYDVRYSPVWCYEGDIITDIPTTQVTLTDLLPNTTYYWAVRAHNYCGQTTSWSSAGQFCFMFKTAPTGVDTPTLVLPPDGTTCGAAETFLSWTHAEDSDHYEVQIGTSCGTGPVYESTGNNFATVGLESDVTYYWRVRTFHECGPVSDWSPCRSFSLDLEPPQNPPGVVSTSHTVATWSTDDTVDVIWDWGSDNCDGVWTRYATVWDRSPTTEPTEPTTSGEFTYETSPPLEDGDDHWFHLRAVDWAGNPAVETLHLGPFWIDTTPPDSVQIEWVSLPIGLVGNFNELTVDWAPGTDDVSGVVGYSYLFDETPLPALDDTVDTSLDIATLPMQWGNWAFRIAAVNGAGIMGPITEVGPFMCSWQYPAFLNPVAGQEVVEGNLVQIQWEEVTRAIDGALHLSLDGGWSFSQIATLTEAQVEGGLYPWMIPAETTTEAVLMLEVNGISGWYTTVSCVFSMRAVTEVDVPPHDIFATRLEPSYPNPFNPQTTIAYVLPAPTVVTVEIIDAQGRLVRTLVRGETRGPGRHEIVWDGTCETGRRVSSGVYLCRLVTSESTTTRGMVLVK